MTDVLVYADSTHSPEMRHEVPVSVSDPFLYAEHDGRRCVVVSPLETERIRRAGLELITQEELGRDDLVASGMNREEIALELALRACKSLGIRRAAVPGTFPIELADHLRANGIELSVDRDLFATRRRVKTEAELEGIRRAQKAAEAGMKAAREILHRAEERDGMLLVEGEQLTCELMKRAVVEAFADHDATADHFTLSHGAQTAVGHERGSGPIEPGEPILIDLFPRDRESSCYADMTRTFVVGEPAPHLREYHRLCLEALERALAGARAGVVGHELFADTCRLFEEHGYPTLLSKERGEVLEEGFFHSLGHGVGLQLHEKPSLGMTREEPFVAGDVISIEPGLYKQGYGGCRLEDLVLVTENGVENLTDFSYDLKP